MKNPLLFSFMMFFLTSLCIAQSLTETELSEPGNITYVVKDRSIYYGKIPPNDNGSLIIFSHGFNGDIDTFLKNENELYKDAYTDGYRTAFVNTTKGEGDWENGKILAQGIDQATDHFHNIDAFLVVHSNGGKASEVALFEENKRDKIKRVVTLGTPFRGTPLADVAQNIFFRWISNLIGIGKGTQLSTTYYCDKVFRPYFDNHQRNQPEKYATLGTWGWNKGQESSALATFSGLAIYFLGKGISDGVTPYYSSNRPGGEVILPYDQSQSGYYNHFDLPYGQRTWTTFVVPYLNTSYQPVQSSTSNGASRNSSLEDYKVESNYQLTYPENAKDELILNPNYSKISINVLREKEGEVVNIREGKLLKKTLSRGIGNSELSINDYKGEKVEIDGDGKYLAFVEQPNGQPIIYSIHNASPKTNPILSVEVPTQNKKDTEIEAVASRVSDLYGNVGPDTDQEFTIKFKWNSRFKHFEYDTKGLKDGIYSLMLTTKKADEYYRRSLVSGFTIGYLNSKSDNKAIEIDTFSANSSIKVFPNPLQIDSQLVIKGQDPITSVKIYNTAGQLMIEKKGTQAQAIGSYTESFSKGVYMVTVEFGQSKQSIKVIK